jgi:alanyl-tRNA synthetase
MFGQEGCIMSAHRIYQNSPYQKSFNARIIRTEPDACGYRVFLDQTAFYPASGGQPGDRGFLNDIPVLDVVEADGDPAHIIPALPVDTLIAGTVDWQRRFDHMQQHTGQHILSQALLRSCGGETVSFHLTEQTVSIDVAIPDLTLQKTREAEALANEIIYANLPVVTLTLSLEEAAARSWRTAPPEGFETIRGIQIGDFDLCGCGGTHVAATGEIGLIKVQKTTPHRLGTRVQFACGRRALDDYREKNLQIQEGVRILGVPENSIIEFMQQLQQDHFTMQKECKDLTRRLDHMTAETLLAKSAQKGEIRCISQIFSHYTMDRLKEMATYLAGQPGTYVLLAAREPKPAVVFARSADLTPSMAALLKQLLTPRGGRGGGQEQSAQGGGVAISELPEILAQAEKFLLT